jgi:hypothetical protein
MEMCPTELHNLCVRLGTKHKEGKAESGISHADGHLADSNTPPNWPYIRATAFWVNAKQPTHQRLVRTDLEGPVLLHLDPGSRSGTAPATNISNIGEETSEFYNKGLNRLRALLLYVRNSWRRVLEELTQVQVFRDLPVLWNPKVCYCFHNSPSLDLP